MLKLEVQAITDPLTELFNRRYFLSAIEKEFNRTVRYKSPTSCLMIDIDHFKKINDAYGHRAGDISLKETAAIIKNCTRDVDTVARWGGEEFIVLLPETGGEDALLVAAKILSAVSHHAFTAFPERITVSIGLATVPEPHIDTAEKLIHEADLALYEAKTKGRNRIAVSD